MRHKCGFREYSLHRSLQTSSASSFASPDPLFDSDDPATTEIYTLSLHDALPISTLSATGDAMYCGSPAVRPCSQASPDLAWRSEEHTSELQSQSNIVCRLLLEKKKSLKEKTAVY